MFNLRKKRAKQKGRKKNPRQSILYLEETYDINRRNGNATYVERSYSQMELSSKTIRNLGKNDIKVGKKRKRKGFLKII